MNLSDLRFALANLVPTGDSNFQRTAARLTTLSNLFFDHYGDGPVSILRAPARINVLGEHIDYVSYLPTASLTFGSRERDALMMYRRSSGPTVRCLSSSARYEPSAFSIRDAAIHPFEREIESEWLEFLFAHGTPKPHWHNYVQGAVTFARGKFGEEVLSGFDFALDSNIPAGGGASSSSALVVLGGAAIRDINGIPWSPAELAKDSSMAEWFVGTRGGSMDHTTICLAQPAKAVLINYAGGKTGSVALPDEPFEWITFFSEPADKGREVMIEYNERAAVSRLLIPALIESWKLEVPDRYRGWREIKQLLANSSVNAFDAALTLLSQLPETISIETLRTQYPATFSELERSFPALLKETSRWPLMIRIRALHHIGEVKRVALATDTLQAIQDDENSDHTFSAMKRIGKLLDDSHSSLRDLYEVSAPEVEDLIGVIRDDAHVLGARLMGGGFGGNVLALTTRDQTQSLIQRVQEHYYSPRDRSGVREGSVMVSTAGPGLAHLDLNSLWCDAIANLNAPEARSGTRVTNLRALLDTAPVSFDSSEIWPVIVAAGKGARASESGLKDP
jgi:galactokinase